MGGGRPHLFFLCHRGPRLTRVAQLAKAAGRKLAEENERLRAELLARERTVEAKLQALSAGDTRLLTDLDALRAEKERLARELEDSKQQLTETEQLEGLFLCDAFLYDLTPRPAAQCATRHCKRRCSRWVSGPTPQRRS